MGFLQFLTFPSFNIYSSPLLVLVLQGLIFGILLLLRYRQRKTISDLLLGLILIITCYHQTTYTIGFMDWYDTFPNTKINYYLVDLGLILAPLIYFYVKSITTSNFKFYKKDFYHFIPGLLFFLIKMGILAYDASLPGFADTQNGYLVINFQWKYLNPFMVVISYLQMLLYLAFTFQLFFNYRSKIRHFFSNTYKLELNWIRNFLYLYSFIFLYGIFQTIIDVSIADLSWQQEWWYYFFSSLIIIYVGVKGYFTDTIKLTAVNFESDEKSVIAKVTAPYIEVSDQLKEKKAALKAHFENKKSFLSPDLTLIELAEEMKMNRAELSEVINSGFGLNFNDFVNEYRVEAFKEKLDQGQHQQLSLLGIAYDCGFNSKATFNRVFKKLTHTSPTEFLNSKTK